MDPNETLARLLRAAEEFRKLELHYDSAQTPGEVRVLELAQLTEELAEAVGDLDRWLSKGGFLPTRWERTRATRTLKKSPRKRGHLDPATEAQAREIARLEARKLVADLEASLAPKARCPSCGNETYDGVCGACAPR